jgi:hypothetical protein
MGMTTAMPAAPGTLSLDRIAIDANTALPIDGELALIAMESGTASLLCDAPLTVFRAAGPPQQVAARTDVTIGAGDSVLLGQNVCGELRNAGPEQARMLTLAVASKN